MTSTVNQKHLCFTVEVIRGYSFVYTKDNHKVCITAFNLRKKKENIQPPEPRGSNMLQIQDFSHFMFCNHGKTIEMNFP